jgi:branched-chain amino acid transport system substrate-binding protein
MNAIKIADTGGENLEKRISMKSAITKVQGIIVAVIIIIALIIGVYYATLPSPTPIATPTPSPTPIATPTPSPTPIATPTPSPTGPTPTPTPTPTPIPTPTPTPITKEIRIGAILPMTGSAALNGRRMADGASLAVEEINAAGGILGAHVKLIIEDHADSSDQALKAAQKLVIEDKVQFVVGFYFTGCTLAATPFLCDNKVITIVTLASSVDITKQVLNDYSRFKYLFKISGNSTDYASVMKEFMGVINKKSLYIIAEDLKWTKDVYAIFEETYVKTGEFTVLKVSYEPTDAKDFSTELLDIKTLKPDAVIWLGATAMQLIFARQYMSDPILKKIPVFFTGGPLGLPSTVEELESSAPGITNGAVVFDYGLTTGRVGDTLPYLKRFQERFGYEPFGYYEFRTYDAIYMIKYAIEKARTLEPDELVKVLESIDYKGVDSRYVFTSSHQALWGPEYHTAVIYEWWNREKIILWPARWATGTYRWVQD